MPNESSQSQNPLDGRFGKTSEGPRDKVGLALSGGGYKAALFHLGGLIRLNELGLLPQINRFSSVSGGSITSAWLGLNWAKLSFDAGGVATNFRAVVREPLEAFCATAKIDVAAGLGGVLNPFSSTGQDLAKAYARRLFHEATLQDLPDPATGAPTFVFNATNMQLNSLWRFSRKRASDWRVGEVIAPKLPLAKVVAASSGFPPIFSPVVFEWPAGAVKPLKGADRHEGEYLKVARVADGGIYDNLGLETVWGRCETVLVSNAGDPYAEEAKPATNWLGQLRRTISTMHRQCENHRVRWLIDEAKKGDPKVAAWFLRGRVSDFKPTPPSTLSLSLQEADEVGEVGVRLWPPSEREGVLLIRHGYSTADASVRSFWRPGAPPPTTWP